MAEIVAQSQAGAVRGITLESGIHRFLGVPYGASTGGMRRFRPPLPAEPWEGVRDALEFGHRSPQDMTRVRDEDPSAFTGPDTPSEDCLVANVWTPSVGDGARRPVMLWLHGGGFSGGAASSIWCDGENLAKRGDVVIVSINHRLNVFGFLHLEDLCGPEFAGSGVAGMLDIVLALEWVRDNIEAFGGDPSNVTVFGESGGGRKVCMLLGMPSARGLFHRAIVESGAHPRGVDRTLATHFATRLFEGLGLRVGDVEALQAIPHDELYTRTMAAIAQMDDPELPASRGMLLSPVVDGHYLPAHPLDPASPEGFDVPLIIGTNKDEMAWTLAGAPNAGTLAEEELVGRLRRVFGDRTETVIDAHRRNHPQLTPWELLVSITSEDRRLLSIEVAEEKAKQHASGGAPVYMYLFTWESNHGLLKAAHTMEIPFVFHNEDRTTLVGTREDRHALADAMADTWLAFARTGCPDNPAIPEWRPYNAEDRATMIFDVPSRLELDPRREERLAWGDLRPSLPWEGRAFVGAG
ncbi:MAG: carboxylesterase family protein [Dehalococcoidia bacterium]|nr:carboxylesterase family protein [Dehalococcoidia bacterium]